MSIPDPRNPTPSDLDEWPTLTSADALTEGSYLQIDTGSSGQEVSHPLPSGDASDVYSLHYLVKIVARSSANVTLAMKIQHSNDSGSTWTTHTAVALPAESPAAGDLRFAEVNGASTTFYDRWRAVLIVEGTNSQQEWVRVHAWEKAFKLP
jgi:hypothetical protein